MRSSPAVICLLACASLLLPAPATAQDRSLTPATETLAAAGFQIVDPETRARQLREMSSRQRLHSAALMGAGITVGALLGISHNEWHPIDEGWWGVGMIASALATGIYGFWDTTTWRLENVRPRIVRSTTRSRVQQRAALSAAGGVAIVW